MKFVLALMMTLTAVSCHANTECWKPIADSSMHNDWRAVDENKFLRVNADFNGDGISDFAEIKQSCDKKRVALFAFVNEKNKRNKSFFLADIDSNQLSVYGVKLTPPGDYLSACQKGYFECASTQASTDVLHQSVQLFKYEGVSSIFFWDPTSNNFKRVWIDD